MAIWRKTRLPAYDSERLRGERRCAEAHAQRNGERLW